MIARRMRPRTLKKGERVRLQPGGDVYRVVRVNDCAAYLAREGIRHVRIVDPITGEVTREFDAHDTEVNGYAPTAAVYRVAEEGENHVS